MDKLRAAVPALVEIDHIGSTSIPGICAKPILDLLGAGSGIAALDASRAAFEAMGYAWRGEYGLAGRRYLTKDDPASGERRIQLHCYNHGSSEIIRHLAFRDLLRADPQLASEYCQMKRGCARLHSDDSHTYADCKDAWIKRVEAMALAGR